MTPSSPLVMAFVAWSGTGKTTLVENVVKLANEKGLCIGALKHDAHRFEIDKPGKDSHRLFAAGAESMMIVSDEKLALVRRHETAPGVDELIAQQFSHCDLVLVEGWKNSNLPRIEVHRPALERPLLCRDKTHDHNLVAVASDAPVDVDVPVLDLNQPATVLDFILDKGWLS